MEATAKTTTTHGSTLLERLMEGVQTTSTPSLLAGLGVTLAAAALGTAYLLVLRRPAYASFTRTAAFPSVAPSVLYDFLVEPAHYYDPRINRKGYKPIILEREDGKITYQLEDDAFGGLIHFSTPVVRRFYEHPDGRDSDEGEGERHAGSRVLILDCQVFGVFVKIIWHFSGRQYVTSSEEGDETEAKTGTDVKLKVSLQGTWWKVKMIELGMQKELSAKLARLQILVEQGGLN